MTVQIDPERTEIKHLKRLVDFTGKHVLEVGCGDGRLTWRYAGSAGLVTGIDLHPDDLRIAVVDRPSDLEDKVFFARTDSVNLPFVKESFDIAVFAWSF
jgi:ubiquinone/menaquinone biosynthesis C-methylase UbiE